MNDLSRANRWSVLLLVIGTATVLLGTAAGSQGWQAWWSVGADAVSQQIVFDIRLPRSLGAWLGGRCWAWPGRWRRACFATRWPIRICWAVLLAPRWVWAPT